MQNLLSQQDDQESSQNEKSDSLDQIKVLLSMIIEQLESNKLQEKQKADFEEIFGGLVDWGVTKWESLAASVCKGRAVLNITQQLQDMKSYDTGGSGINMLSLHDLIKGHGQDSIGTLIVFKRGGTVLSPCSKIQFYSDPDGTNLVKDILAGEEMNCELPPMLLNEGKIWVSFEEGTNALLSLYDQQDVKAKLECAIFQIPKDWSVVCWLSEVLTSCLIRQSYSKIAPFVLSVFEKLIKSLARFY